MSKFDNQVFKRKYQRNWYRKHKKRAFKWMNDYYSQNREKILIYKKDWYARHRIQTNKASFISRLHHTYGISIQEYKSMVRQQKGKCLICKTVPKDTLHIDHCHKTKVVRGLLCRSCNNGLGLFKDDILLLGTAINYLKGVTNVQQTAA